MSAEPKDKTQFTPRDRWLVASFLGGPMAWFLHLNICYALVPESCDHATKMMLHFVTIGCVAVALISASIGWRIRLAALAEGGSDLSAGRTQWLATCAVVICMTMVVTIIAQELPNILLRSCD